MIDFGFCAGVLVGALSGSFTTVVLIALAIVVKNSGKKKKTEDAE